MIEFIIKTTALPKLNPHIWKLLVLEISCCEIFIAFIFRGSPLKSLMIVLLQYSSRKNQDVCSPQTESTYLETHPLLHVSTPLEQALVNSAIASSFGKYTIFFKTNVQMCSIQQSILFYSNLVFIRASW